MRTINMMKITGKILTLIALLASAAAFAGNDGNSVGGGGNSFGSKFFDNVLRKNKWDPKSDKCYATHVVPVLNYIKKGIPDFTQDLEHVLATKKWYSVERKMKQLPPSATGILFDADQMAYQDDESVYIDKELYDGASCEDKASLIIHELIQGLRIAGGNNVQPINVVRLNMVIADMYDEKSKDYKELRKQIIHYLDVGYFLPDIDPIAIKKDINKMALALNNICKTTTDKYYLVSNIYKATDLRYNNYNKEINERIYIEKYFDYDNGLTKELLGGDFFNYYIKKGSQFYFGNTQALLSPTDRQALIDVAEAACVKVKSIKKNNFQENEAEGKQQVEKPE